MRVDIVLISTFVLVPSLVFAADYNVPEGGTLAKAIAEANANKDGDMYEIEISGRFGKCQKQCVDSRKSVGGIVRLACL